MRVVLDTDKENHHCSVELSSQIDEYNKMVMEISGDESKKKSFKGYIDEIWKECMADSDKCLVTESRVQSNRAWERRE